VNDPLVFCTFFVLQCDDVRQDGQDLLGAFLGPDDLRGLVAQQHGPTAGWLRSIG